MNQFNINQFTVVQEQQAYVSEISTLTKGGEFPLCTKLDEDNTKVGFRIISTGGTMTFYLRETHRNEGNEVTHWIFGPTEKTINAYPDLRNITVTVFND